VNWIDRLIMFIAPSWGRSRVQARVLARHFEAASIGRRTSGWSRTFTDANRAAAGTTLDRLRAQGRDLVRNNPWARRGLRRIVTNTVGWGIKPKANGRNADRISDLWKRWAETTQCDATGRLTMYGLQKLVMRTIVESGEVLILRRIRLQDGLAIPMQLQVLEPDFIDTSKDGVRGVDGPIIQGVELDSAGRRVAYWLFDEHPGGGTPVFPVSRRIPAAGVLHVFDQERAGQVRGPSWFASVDVRLHDFDEFEDATLMKQKIAACMAAFVTDLDGTGAALGAGGTDLQTNQPIDSMEPGMIVHLPTGKQVEIASPPQATDHQSFSATALRGVAAGLGVTYEDLTGDYSQVNYSSARMARIAHNADVHDWRWNMLIPQFCVPVWDWMIDMLILTGQVAVVDAPATWTPPPLPMLDPGKEAEATKQAVRMGQMTPDEMVREQGLDPDEHWTEYAESIKRLDKLRIVLDSDPRKTDNAGKKQRAEAGADADAEVKAETPAPTTNGVSKKSPAIADA
jgi:lambda family phage portal protein